MESPSQASPPEAVSLDQFVKLLMESGLLPPEEVKALATQVPPGQRKDAKSFAQELMKQGKLTKYQAGMLYAGKSKGLALGNYAILEKIGQGGMGMVFRAQHRRMQRVVALKVLPPELTKNLPAVQRFQREVQAAAKLSHSNIVAAHDADEFQGVHFLVMEYVDGSDLANLVKKRGPLPVTQAVDCILQAARGLAHAHQSGVIHRDIKPHNLLLDKSGTLKILDMGLARFDGAENNASATAVELTKSGSIMGTVDYMAPEQAVNTKKADHRADIYSLGCTLYYLVSGIPIYAGETSMEKLLAHREEPIPPLPHAPKPLQVIYQKMVAKKPEDRYQSMADVIVDLGACRASGALDDQTPPLAAGKQPMATGDDAETKTHVQAVGTDELSVRRHRPVKRWLLFGTAAAIGLVLPATLLVYALGKSTRTVADATATALQASQELDLLKLIDPKRDAVKGEWRWEGKALVTPKEPCARLQILFVPPAEYELEALVTRREGDDNFGVGVVAGEQQSLVAVDWSAGSGLHLLDGKWANANETTFHPRLFTNGQPAGCCCRSPAGDRRPMRRENDHQLER